MKKQYFILFVTAFLSVFPIVAQNHTIDSLKQALERVQTKEDKLATLDTLSIHLRNGSYLEGALPYFTQFASVAKEIGNYEQETRAYSYISEVYIKQMDSVKAKAFAIKALQKNDSIDNLRGYLLATNQLGRVYHNFQNFHKAIETYLMGINRFEAQDITETEGKKYLAEIATIYGNLSSAYERLGETEKSISTILKASDFAEKANKPTQKAYSLYRLGYIYMGLNNLSKAETYFLKSLRYADSVSLKAYTNMNHHALGINYSRWGKYDKALEYNKKALAFFRKENNKLYEFDVLNNIAVVYDRTNTPDSILKYASLALNIAKEINHKMAIDASKLALSNAHIELKQYSKAKKYLFEIVKDTVDTSIIDRSSKAEIFSKFSEIYEEERNYKEALKYYKKYQVISDSIQKERLDSKYVDIEIKYQTERKEKENLRLKAENAEQELLAQKANTQKNTLAFGLIIMAISALFFWIKYRSEAKAKKIIAGQKETIESLQGELNHRVKNNLEIINSFVKDTIDGVKDKEVKKTLFELHNRILSINEVHWLFYKGNNTEYINLHEYIETLVNNVAISQGNKNIKVEQDIDSNITFPTDKSTQLGLIVNEFLTNSYKHAFNEKEHGEVKISIHEIDQVYRISLSDTGKGMLKDFDFNSATTFGLRSMKLLTQQLGGNFNLQTNNGLHLDIMLDYKPTIEKELFKTAKT